MEGLGVPWKPVRSAKADQQLNPDVQLPSASAAKYQAYTSWNGDSAG
ncbi:hypothetical protein HaLaN_13311 [Haematococcus lacustris]|uniref:Uncharacterized protein n=1 Tax=Haematococcus lacustris TaxID=44745 RepID=A0A699ZD54_HAELA|nr:hypothetical protein HaLaN_13311 [Haematococcus lacustris]